MLEVLLADNAQENSKAWSLCPSPPLEAALYYGSATRLPSQLLHIKHIQQRVSV